MIALREASGKVVKIISETSGFFQKSLTQKSDLENETHFPFCHCEHLKGACLHAEVLTFMKQICAAKRSGMQA
jgi:hypothetical protein